ncbi:hypothetical protein AB4Y98_02260, partial [Stenotrophomonas sp. 2YAF26]
HDLRQHLRQELEAVLDETGIPLLLISHDPQVVPAAGRQRRSANSSRPAAGSTRGTVQYSSQWVRPSLRRASQWPSPPIASMASRIAPSRWLLLPHR